MISIRFLADLRDFRWGIFGFIGAVQRIAWQAVAVPTRLKHVDPRRRPSVFSRANAVFANTRLGRFLSVHVVWKIDPWLMRVTGGRLGFGIGIPTALLETTGAKSGEP